MSEINRHKVERGIYSKLLIQFHQNKESIQKRLNDGAKMKDIASEHGIPMSTLRDIFDATGLEKPAPKEKPVRGGVSPARFDAMQAQLNATTNALYRLTVTLGSDPLMTELQKSLHPFLTRKEATQS